MVLSLLPDIMQIFLHSREKFIKYYFNLPIRPHKANKYFIAVLMVKLLHQPLFLNSGLTFFSKLKYSPVHYLI